MKSGTCESCVKYASCPDADDVEFGSACYSAPEMTEKEETDLFYRMKDAIIMIKDSCAQFRDNFSSTRACMKCPFEKICDSGVNFGSPSEWNI